MAYKKLANFTSSLHRRTMGGTIEWEETALRGVYQASLANYSVRISLVDSQDHGGLDANLSIINDEGSEVESFLDVDLQSEWFRELGVAGSSFEIMSSIFHTARRIALGSEKAINDILEELDDDVVPTLDDDEVPF